MIDLFLFLVEIFLGMLMLLGIVFGAGLIFLVLIKNLKWFARKGKNDENNYEGVQITPKRRANYIRRQRHTRHGDESSQVSDGLLEAGERTAEHGSEGTSDEYVPGELLDSYGRLYSTYDRTRRED